MRITNIYRIILFRSNHYFRNFIITFQYTSNYPLYTTMTKYWKWKILISREWKINLSLTTERLDFNYSKQKRAYSLYLYALQWPWRAGTFPSWTSEGCSVCKLGVGASGGRRKLRNSRCIIYPAVDTRQHASSR